MALLCHLLQPQDTLSLHLEEALPGQQADIIHALGVGHPEPGALPTRQQKDSHFVLRDLKKAWGEG